jgi:hypothetical protein
MVSFYLLPIQTLFESDLTERLNGVFPDMAGDLNTKHADWNSKLIKASGSLLRDYASRKSCSI